LSSLIWLALSKRTAIWLWLVTARLGRVHAGFTLDVTGQLQCGMLNAYLNACSKEGPSK